MQMNRRQILASGLASAAAVIASQAAVAAPSDSTKKPRQGNRLAVSTYTHAEGVKQYSPG